jgi:ribosome-associated protein
MTSRNLAKLIAQAALDIKGFDLNVIDLRKQASFADFFIIISGRSDRQVQAICDNVLEKVKAKKIRPSGVEGYNAGHWILIDFFDVVVHIFYEETRDFYALDKLWGQAPSIDLHSTAVKNKVFDR